MSKRPMLPMASTHPAAMGNPDRLTLLMSISEITPQIFLSGQMAATLEQVQKLGITYILNVAAESSAIVYPKNIKLEKYDIIDYPTAPISNYFNTLTDKMHTHLNANYQNKVLVHCMAGISRSTSIVCAYLMRHMNMTLRDAYLLCKRHRPICFPNLGFWSQLIAYEYQLRKENSVRMIPTQFGQVPDVAFEEIGQVRNQPQPASLPFCAPTFTSTASHPSIISSTNNDTLFVSSNQTRPTARDIPVNSSTNTSRSRSLASNTASRPSVAAASTYVSNPAVQTPLFTTNKQSFSTPTRFGISRLNPSVTNTSLPVEYNPYGINRNVPISTSLNAKPGNNYHYQPTAVTTVSSNPSTTSNNGPQRSHYETTYRSSFIKPLIP